MRVGTYPGPMVLAVLLVAIPAWAQDQAQAPAPAPAPNAAPAPPVPPPAPAAGDNTAPATVTVPATAIVPGPAPVPGAAAPADSAPAPAPDAVSPMVPDQWITYKGDLQRTCGSSAHTGLPLCLQWRHTLQVNPQPNNNSPLVVGPRGQRRLYFALGRHIYCLDAQTGTEYWHTNAMEGPVTAPLTLMTTKQDGDVILAVTDNGTMSAIRTSDGGLVWSAAARAPVQSAAPLLVQTPKGPLIIVGIATGFLIAFTTDGALDPDWEVRLGPLGGTPTSTPALSEDGNLLYVTTEDQHVYAVNVERAKLAYSLELPTSSFTTPVVIADHLIVTAGTEIRGYALKTGELRWDFDLRGQIFASPAARLNDLGDPVCYCGAANGNFYAINVRTGRIVWKTNKEASLTGVPLVLPGVVIVGSHNGLLFGMSPDDGHEVWQYRLQTERQTTVRENPGGGNIGGGGGGEAGGSKTVMETFGVSSPPSVVDGQLFLIPDNAEVYAFSTDDLDAEPPLIIQPSLSYLTQDNKLKSYLLDPDGTQLVPGRPPLYFAAQLADAGSGIDPGSIKVTFEQQEIVAKNVLYNPARGVLTVILLEQPKEGARTVLLGEGRKTITLAVKDYRGNETDYTGSFLVDNTMTPPPSQPGAPGADPGGAVPAQRGVDNS